MSIDSTAEVFLDSPDSLYRLALLVTGDARAAVRLVVQAIGGARLAGSDGQAALLRGLVPKRADYGRWQPTAAALQRAALTSEQARALLALLAKCAPAERLIIGLHYLRGVSVEELPALSNGSTPLAPALVLAQFRAGAALALKQVLESSDHSESITLDRWLDGGLAEAEALDMRARTLADSETRQLRDGLLATRALLPMALTGLFAVTPPVELLTQLQPKPTRTRPRPGYLDRRAAYAALIGGVLAVAALLAFLPGTWSRPTRSTISVGATDVLDAAIRRFQMPPLDAGVLHERYRVEIAGKAPQIIERWYDYSLPHRLAAEVRTEGQDEATYAIRTNGRALVEYQVRYGSSQPATGLPTRIDYQIAGEEPGAVIAVLRSAFMPIHLFQDAAYQPEISGLFLAQARTSGAALLGRSSVGGREAYLLRYTTNRLPGESNPGEPRQVLVAIDTQLSAVLEITVLSVGESESVAARPWRTEVIEVLDTANAAQFTFGDSSRAQTVTGPRSMLAPSIPSLFTSLDEAQRESQRGLLLPTEPPTGSRGLVMALRGDQRAARYGLMYEGEFQSVMLLPDPTFSTQALRWLTEEREAGGYRYRIAEPLRQLADGLFAQVYPIDQPGQRFNIILQDSYSTGEEREQRMVKLIESLEPVTADNVEALQRGLVPLPHAGGTDATTK